MMIFTIEIERPGRETVRRHVMAPRAAAEKMAGQLAKIYHAPATVRPTTDKAEIAAVIARIATLCLLLFAQGAAVFDSDYLLLRPPRTRQASRIRARREQST